ncbi:thymidylate synthase [Rhodobacteraceae bacterium R_SAG4]|nr:thymidylate synthase [Rhodobacteraceae bacterium R_SAG4]
MFVEVVLASRCKQTGRKVYTLHLRYPRIIHGELMTHRVFNRNARSSRAVPIMTLLAEIRSSAFIPWHWTGKQKGMQGVPNWQSKVLVQGAAALHVDADTPVDNVAAWLWGRDMMCDLAESFEKADYHKQVANRLVEPWMWMDLLVTSVHWANFLHLRDHPAAEPHIRDLAVLVGKALEAAECQDLDPGEWHLPYVFTPDWEEARSRFALEAEQIEWLKQISAARCARISYAPFDGDASYEREIERFELLVGDDAIHASPLEHQCTPDRHVTVETTYWEHDGTMIRDEARTGGLYPNLHASLTGFIQFRKTVPNEAVHD